MTRSDSKIDGLAAAGRQRHRALLLLAMVLLAGGALRIWYASAQLHINRFEDERYSLQNVRKIYHLGDLEPASGYYPSPVFNLPQVWSLRAAEMLYLRTGDETLRPVGENGRLLAAGFFVTRLYQVLCGTLTLLLVFLVARRLMNERVALLAATALAFLPWMIHSSGYNKPDALLVMGVCLSFWASLRAVDSGSLRDYLLAGGAIAVAMSAKLTGGLAAVPLVVATLFFLREPQQARRRVLLLAAAGLSSAVLFIALNPYWKAYLHFIRGLQRDYAGRTDASRLEMPLRIAEMHVGDLLYGPVLGALALFAFALLLGDGVRRVLRRDAHPTAHRPRAHRLAMLLAFPIAYTAAYAVQTSYFKPNNFLPIVPFTAIALAWLLDAGWRLATRLRSGRSVAGWSEARWSVVGWLAALVFAAALFVPGYRYVEHSVVPTTVDAARLWLHYGLDPAVARLVYRESWRPPELAWEGTRQLHGGLSAEVEIDELDLPRLAGADAVVLRLDRAGREGLEDRLRGAGFSEFQRSEPRWWHLRGPPLLTATRPWSMTARGGAPLSSCGSTCFSAPIEAAAPAGEKIVAFLWLPTSMAPPDRAPRLLVLGGEGGELDLPLHFASRKGHGHLFVSPRFDAAGVKELRFVAEQDYGPGLRATQVEIHRWSSPEL